MSVSVGFLAVLVVSHISKTHKEPRHASGLFAKTLLLPILSVSLVPATPSHTWPVDSRSDTHQDHFLFLWYWGDLFSNSKQFPEVHTFTFFSSTFLFLLLSFLYASLHSIGASPVSKKSPIPIFQSVSPIPNHHQPTSFICWHKDNASG